MSLTAQSAQWLPLGVRVSVLRARGLRIKGKDGTNDAYVALQAGRESFRTPVAERLAEPVWGEESGAFVFTTPPDGGALQVRVMHRVPLGADRLLGLSVINLHELRSNLTENPQWFKLLNKAGKADKERGEVQLDVQFLKSSTSVSMIDLSDKSHSRFGKFKDKLRGKHKDSLGDSASAILPPTSQVLTDSEEEAEPQGEGETPKKKKNKLKSLFVPKSNLQRNVSQSMSALGTLPDRKSSISSSTSSGLNLEPSEGKGKKKFKFLTHKRNSSTDSKTSSQSNLFLSSTNQSATSQVGVCVNGSHVYSGEPEPLDVEEDEEDENWRQDEEAMEQMEEEKGRIERETEMRRKMEEEEKERKWRMAEEERMEEERIRKMQKIKEEQHRMMEEEKKRTEEREAEEQRRKLEEDRKRRMAEEETIEKERKRIEDEKLRIEREKAEQIKRVQEDNERRMKMEREEEEQRKVKEDRQRREEEIRKLEEEREMIEEQKRKSEEEEKERIKVAKEERERRRKMEEKERERIRIEQEETQRLEREKERIMEEQRKESEERKRQEDERERKRIEEMEEERIKAEKKRVEEEKEQERKRRMEEEENRMIEERKRAEKRLRDAEERRKAKEEEQRQKEEDERMQVEKRRQEEKENETKRRMDEENRIKEERIKMEKEQRQKEEDERIRVEEERKMEELRRKKEKQRDEEKEENPMSRSARISAKPSVSVAVINSRSSMVNNPFLDEYDSDSNSSETVTDKTSKKGRAPLPPQKMPCVPNPEESFRGNTLSEGTEQPSKRPAPQPPVRLMVTKDESLNKETIEHHTNPFTCDVPVAAEYKIKLAPKPEAVSSAFGDGLLNFAADQNEANCVSKEPRTSYEENKKKDMMTNWNPLGRSKQPSTPTIQLQKDPLDLLQNEETLKSKVQPDAVISNPLSALISEPKSKSDGVLNMELFQKKSRAPLPPKEPKNSTPKSSSPECNAIMSESALVPERHDNKNNQNPETPASGGAHSLKSTLLGQTQVMQPSGSVEATDTGSGSESALKALPCAKVAPSGGSEVMSHSTSVIRQQAVKPLNSEPEAHDMRSSQLLHHKPKAAEALNKGPYAQLTQPELISLALRQQEQISQRDGRIQQLEQYIDDLLVKVIEEKPSILMQLNTINKST